MGEEREGKEKGEGWGGKGKGGREGERREGRGGWKRISLQMVETAGQSKAVMQVQTGTHRNLLLCLLQW